MAKTFAQYAADLETLLEKGRDAIVARDDAGMKAAHAAIMAFTAGSSDLVPGIIELDGIAEKAMRDLTLARLDRNLIQDLGARSAEIARLTKAFSNQAVVNNSAAAQLRLERVKAVIDATTTAVAELKKLEEILSDKTPKEAAVVSAVGEAITALVGVQKKIVG